MRAISSRTRFPPISRMDSAAVTREFRLSLIRAMRAISSRTRLPPVSRMDSAAIARGFRLFLIRAHACHFLAYAFPADFADGQRGGRPRISPIPHPRPCAPSPRARVLRRFREWTARCLPQISLIPRPRPCVPFPRARVFRQFLGRTSAPARRARRRDRQPRPWHGRWE